ncbi:MAG: hypothetical protein DRN71_05540 [Candidatus Nanohalarchaeota archaeon]|nr:MAG: hypothetical protein DRN71_05540 [Candidatus Nanohaloarchaeota archaeon]
MYYHIINHSLNLYSFLTLFMRINPPKKNNWRTHSNLLIFHGRNTCKSRNPKCTLNKICPSTHKPKKPPKIGVLSPQDY